MTREEHLAAIKQADKAYYEKDNPLLPDTVYDELRKSYIDTYGPEDLDYTPGAVSEGFQPFHHIIPISSLAKVKADEPEKLHAWREKLSPIVLEPKYDGLTVVAYPDGDAYKFVTRGSGTDGEVLPNFISKYEGGGQVLDSKENHIIRGEVMLTKKAFERIREEQKVHGEEPFKNIRNAAAGILRNKERSPYIDELTYICYDVVGWDVSEKRKLDYIRNNTPFTATKCSNDFVIETPDAYIWEQAKKMYELVGEELPLDGIVVKSQKDGSLAELGSTGHHNNNAVALKAVREIHETTLRDIEFSVGRTKITPVAIFDPVEIDGTEVTRASIHNKDYFDEMKLCKGDTVFIYKSNEIIPQIDSVVHNGGEPFVWPKDAVDGDDVLVRDIMHMVSKPVLDIKGLSEATARKLVESGTVKNRNDIFELTMQDIAKLEGLGEKSATKLVDQLQERKASITFPRFMRALCVPGIGAHVGKAVEKEFGDGMMFFVILSNWKNYPREELREKLEAVDGIGPETARILTSKEFVEAFSSLVAHVTIEKPKEKEENLGWRASAFAGKNFVLTGKMPLTRSHYEEVIKKAGGNVQSAVNSKTDFLVIADTNSTSTKARKARELGTELISPEQMETMLL